MKYSEAENFLFGLRRYEFSREANSSLELLSRVEDPHESFDSILVTGSNGKGSTAKFTAGILEAAGFDVGLFVSPHLENVRDSIQVNGRGISKRTLIEFIERVRPSIEEMAAEGVAPTMFETLTPLALWQFDRRDVDVAVVEVGVGGDGDATTVVDPVASAVSTVSLEHTQVLGDTVEEIARTKASIAPEDGPLVTGARGDALNAIRDVTADVVAVGPEGDVSYERNGFVLEKPAVTIQGRDWSVETSLSLLGPHQEQNAAIAAALARTTFDVEPDAIARGVRNTDWKGRTEIVQRDPLVMIDGAHNEDGCRSLAATVDSLPHESLYVVFGSAAVKDHPAMIEALPTPDGVYTCRPDRRELESEDVLARKWNQHSNAPTEAMPSVEDAVEAALDDADPDDCVLVTGSLYTVKEARLRWSRLAVPLSVDSAPDATRAIETANGSSREADRMRERAVHRVVRTRVFPRQARLLERAMERAGGTCTVSAIDEPKHENVDVVLAGTLDSFSALIENLSERQFGLANVARELQSALAADLDDVPSPDHPWTDTTAVMGIINTSPDSFYEGATAESVADVRSQAESMVADGADIIDIGGETNKPGSSPIDVDVELDRTIPYIEALADLDVQLSVDTKKPLVASAALEAGADIINDVSGLQKPEMARTIAEHDASVIIMHSIHTHVDPDDDPVFDDVVLDVIAELRERICSAQRYGIDRSDIIVDPGIGFGKTSDEDLAIMDKIREFDALGCPVLLGHSRKSVFDHIDRESDDRLPGTVAASAIAASNGVDIVRTHDVAENVDAVRLGNAIASSSDRC